MKKRNVISIVPGRVLVVQPHNVEYGVDKRVENFIKKAVLRGVATEVSFAARSPEFARNKAIKHFLLNPDCKKYSHIFFLDADTCPVSDYAIERLLTHQKDVIAGVTPIVKATDTQLRCMWSACRKNEKGAIENFGIDELPSTLFKAERVGGTTLLVSRKVLEKLSSPYQKCTFNEDMTDWTQGEDTYFADKIREAGFDIWVDPEVVCHHYHKFDLLDVFEIWKQAINNTHTAGG